MVMRVLWRHRGKVSTPSPAGTSKHALRLFSLLFRQVAASRTI